MPLQRAPLTIALAALWLHLVVAVAAAGLPPPRFLPGQPMVVGQQVLMIWAPVPGAAAYHVYVNNERVANVTANQHLAQLPSESGSYRFQVAAVDAGGVEGERSEPGIVQVRKLQTPKHLTALPRDSDAAIGLVWDRVEGAVIYNVFRTRQGQERSLLASVQSESFKDATVEAGAAYTYWVTARDVSGMESPASEPATATGPTAQKEVRREIVFRALPTREAVSVGAIGDLPLSQVSYLGVGPRGRVWVVTPRTRQIHVLDGEGLPVASLGPWSFTETGFEFLPHKLDFGPDGRLYVSDAINGVLACIETDGTFLWARGIIAPPANMKNVWGDFPEHMASLPPTPSAVLCLEKEIWLTDQRFQLVYRFDYGGDLLGYVTTYQKQGETIRLSGVGELLRLGEDRYLATFPLSHKAIVVDAAWHLQLEVGTEVRGYIGGFVGIHGAAVWPDGGILLTDPAVGTLQVFDAATGAYRYHVSGPNAQRDPGYAQRADLPVRKPHFAAPDAEGRVWLYDAGSKRIVALRRAGQVTPPFEQ